jgi:hypothetical protein
MASDRSLVSVVHETDSDGTVDSDIDEDRARRGPSVDSVCESPQQASATSDTRPLTGHCAHALLCVRNAHVHPGLVVRSCSREQSAVPSLWLQLLPAPAPSASPTAPKSDRAEPIPANQAVNVALAHGATSRAATPPRATASIGPARLSATVGLSPSKDAPTSPRPKPKVKRATSTSPAQVCACAHSCACGNCAWHVRVARARGTCAHVCVRVRLRACVSGTADWHRRIIDRLTRTLGVAVAPCASARAQPADANAGKRDYISLGNAVACAHRFLFQREGQEREAARRIEWHHCIGTAGRIRQHCEQRPSHICRTLQRERHAATTRSCRCRHRQRAFGHRAHTYQPSRKRGRCGCGGGSGGRGACGAPHRAAQAHRRPPRARCGDLEVRLRASPPPPPVCARLCMCTESVSEVSLSKAWRALQVRAHVACEGACSREGAAGDQATPQTNRA